MRSFCAPLSRARSANQSASTACVNCIGHAKLALRQPVSLAMHAKDLPAHLGPRHHQFGSLDQHKLIYSFRLCSNLIAELSKLDEGARKPYGAQWARQSINGARSARGTGSISSSDVNRVACARWMRPPATATLVTSGRAKLPLSLVAPRSRPNVRARPRFPSAGLGPTAT